MKPVNENLPGVSLDPLIRFLQAIKATMEAVSASAQITPTTIPTVEGA